MSRIQRINPPTLVKMPLYTQAVKVNAGPLLFLAGQVAWDAEGHTVGGGDLRAQATQAFRNIGAVLEEVGATWSHVIKLTQFIAHYNAAEHRPIIVEVMRQFLDVEALPANTLLGVEALARPDLLIEVEAIVALDA